MEIKVTDFKKIMEGLEAMNQFFVVNKSTAKMTTKQANSIGEMNKVVEKYKLHLKLPIGYANFTDRYRT